MMTTLADLMFETWRLDTFAVAAVAVGFIVAAAVYIIGMRGHAHTVRIRLLLLVLRWSAAACIVLALMRPVWISRHVETHRPVVAVIVDDSLSMQECDGGDATRYERGLGFLKSKLEPVINRTHDVQLFDVQGRWLESNALPAQPQAESTPLTDVLVRVQRDLSDRPLAGIVLISDGAERTLRPTSATLEQLRVPVYPVNLAATVDEAARQTNLAIDAVTTNQRAIVGNAVKVFIDLHITGSPPESAVPLRLIDGEHVVATQLAHFAKGEPTTRVEMTFTPNQPGHIAYQVQAAALPDEIHLADNRAVFELDVRGEPLTVIFVDGVLRWEGKFVREALAKDPDVNLISTVRTAPAGTDRGSQGLLLAEGLANVDVVIIGDVEAAFFAGQEMEALRSWVTDAGGGLMITGGYHNFGPDGLRQTTIAGILPVHFSADANPQVEQSFAMRLTPLGQSSPIFNLSGDRARDTAFFQSLPQLGGCSRIAGIKPGAQVLAVNPKVAGPGGGEGLPVMISQEAGKGRTMVFAVDTTWRWRTVMAGFTGDAGFYETFWSQIVRWLAGAEQTRDESELVVTTDRAQYKIGESVEVKASLSADERNYIVRAVAIDERGNRTALPMSRLIEGGYRGTIAALGAGRMDVLVRAEPLAAADDEGALSQIITVEVQRPDVELIDSRPDPQWLALAAQLSGGQIIEPSQVDLWARQLPAEPTKTETIQTTGLWHHPLLATLFFVLLCSEWVLRRQSRLA